MLDNIMKKLAILILLAMTVMVGLPIAAHAGSEVYCVAYGNANALTQCMRLIPTRTGMIAPNGMAGVSNADPYTMQLMASMNSVVPYGPYGAGAYYAQPNPLGVIANVAAGIVGATAYAYGSPNNWVAAQGLYGLSNLAMYPW